MTNADKFKSIFGLYATELWAKPEKDFLEWLNADAELFGISEQLESSHFADHGKMVGDSVSRQTALDALGKDPMGGLNYKSILGSLPSVQPNLSEEYSKAVFTWLMDYQIRTAELKGRYTPYEVLSWVINDWRKEHG